MTGSGEATVGPLNEKFDAQDQVGPLPSQPERYEKDGFVGILLDLLFFFSFLGIPASLLTIKIATWSQ